MPNIVLYCVLSGALLLTACTGEAPATGIIDQREEGGDSTVVVTQLEYLDLELPERHYLVFRQELSLLDMNGFLAMESEALSVAATKANVVATGPLTSLFYAWDTERGWGDAAVALPVAAGTQLPPYVTVTLPATRALALDMDGPYDATSAVHVALARELSRRGLDPVAPSVEEYPVGPLQTSDESAFRTRIIYPYASPAQ